VANISTRVARNGCTISSVTTYDNVGISIATLSGRVIYHWNGSISAGNTNLSFHDLSLSQGNYLFMVTTSGKMIFSQKIAVR